ncbi:uncharacterized protein CANTADRAFT_89414 [Suhomyces tanzawaensis NRRL Y-17324]|uniref:Uncharacterized protein n=1 Tax=Suhomyces tanzawaensis NRRL Y-17324 TaxID=984487 RepID=A0A1E4SJU5_9ASCO|nr:uncharacterized protein CANTADRAFT_89414 [Suhomyces tanzawaensis NRRL Y-17324]ODV79785.1 hypothetical protein CANTADRAFT_89414 [Suhomyces tanzawaensis NRRL Y-17324]
MLPTTVFGGVASMLSATRASPMTIIRGFSLYANLWQETPRRKQDKFYKILKYVKPVDTTEYKAGQEITKGLSIPSKQKQYPDYAYETMFFKRQNRGLYGGLQRKRSKTSSESGNKNLRVHLPNIQKAKLWSETLNRAIQTKVLTKVLKTITKEGGLDNYLTKDKPARVKTIGLKGWRLRYEVLKKREFNELPKVEDASGNTRQVYYIHSDGKQITVGKNKLLKELYPLVVRDSYTPVSASEFRRNHSYLTSGELVDKLASYNYDFSAITV